MAHLEVGERAGEATALSNIGAVYASLEEWDDALINLQVAVALAEQIQHTKLSLLRANLEAVKQEHAKAFSENSNNFLTN